MPSIRWHIFVISLNFVRQFAGLCAAVRALITGGAGFLGSHLADSLLDPAQMGGQPRIRGLRIPVATVVAMVADGMTTPEIVEAHPDLEPEDVREALLNAAEALRERELPLRVICVKLLPDNNLSPQLTGPVSPSRISGGRQAATSHA